MIGRRATRISHSGTAGAHRRMPVIGRAFIGRPANDNPAPRRPFQFWIAAASAMVLFGLTGFYLLS